MRDGNFHWKNARGMLQEVDKLPKTTKWLHKYISVHANPDKTGVIRKVDLYYRDPVSLIRELMGRPGFNKPGVMAYEPVEMYVAGKGGMESREFSEANTGTWWNDIQVSKHISSLLG